ncbi:M48 family metalloprotease [Microbispora sp. NBC_01189]|uniref:M48 family metalloprotease n=1 Tax=Microbispora sp. NBC_01189 TaxID=2903583 RepID=UPI002E11A8D4|nr:M48 family metalloprotease [Microbispora sp. NBC_01189]
MDTVAFWSRRLAEHLVPAEAASAGRVGEAYVAGGRRRRDLLRAAAAEPGGFGGGGAGELPIILDALRVVSGDLLGLLASHPLVNLLMLLALRSGRPAAGFGVPPRAPRPGPAASPDPAPVLDQTIAGLRNRLRAQGVAGDRAESLTYDTLKLVFQQDRDPAEIEAFLRALSGSPPAGPPAGPATTRALAGRGGDSSDWLLPPWLWFYFLGVLAPGVPGALDGLRQDADGMTVLVGSLLTNAERGAAALLTATGALEFLPALLLLAGIAGVLFPGARGRWAEHRHRLLPSDDPVIEAMTAFVRSHAPAAGVRLGERHDRLARVYPVGWREARVAVYPPLVSLWSRDREAARAVLLHEVAHLRQGDHLIVGLAGPFAWVVRMWGAALAVLTPVSAVYLVADGAGGSSLFAAVLKVVAALPITLILPVAGLWAAELSADRYAMSAVGPAALARALGPARPRAHPVLRALALLSHPPLRLRLWAARLWPGGTAALAALWPLAIVVRIAAIVVFQLIALNLTGSSFGESVRTVIGWLPERLSPARTQLTEITALLVAWPLIAPLWLRVWTPVHASRQRFAPYLVSALVPGLLASGSLGAGPSTGSGPAGPVPGATATVTAVVTTAAPQATADRTGLIDDRPWTGQELPVDLRIQAPYRKLEQHGDDPEWRSVAAGWLGAGAWRAERDGRLAFSDLAKRPGLRPTEGGWLRIGDTVTFWLPVERDAAGETMIIEINGTIDLSGGQAVMDALWARKPDGSAADLGSFPDLEFTAVLDVSTAP